MHKLSAADIVNTLRDVVAESPEYVYEKPEHMTGGPSCLYVHTDADGSNPVPGCLVGKVLNKLGVPLEELWQREGSGAWSDSMRDNLYSIEGTPDEADEAQRMLETAQDVQDSGLTWEEALRCATRGLGE